MRKNSDYFNMRNYVPNYRKTHLNKVIVFNGGRNIGKSTSVWNEIENYYMTPESRFVYVRNNGEKLKRAKSDFNDRFKHRFKMTDTHVYQLNKKEKKDGEVYYTNGEIVGYVSSVSTYQNDKSGQFPNVKFIFHEEYNENTKEKDIFFKWTNLLTNFIRFNDVIIVIVGNRDDVNNEFMVKWGVDIAESFNETSLQVIKDGNGDDFIYFYELGTNDFLNLKNYETTFFKLAQFDAKSRNYINGKYSIDRSKNVLNFHKHILPTANLNYIFSIDKQDYFFGNFVLKNKKVFFLSDEYITPEINKNNINKLSLNSFSDLIGENTMLDKDDKTEIKEFFINLFRHNKIYFTSFYLQSYIELFITI